MRRYDASDDKLFQKQMEELSPEYTPALGSSDVINNFAKLLVEDKPTTGDEIYPAHSLIDFLGPAEYKMGARAMLGATAAGVGEAKAGAGALAGVAKSGWSKIKGLIGPSAKEVEESLAAKAAMVMKPEEAALIRPDIARYKQTGEMSPSMKSYFEAQEAKAERGSKLSPEVLSDLLKSNKSVSSKDSEEITALLEGLKRAK